jgi:hypothetical protein
MVQIVRRGHVDDIEIVGSDKLLVVAVGLSERHARGEFLGSVSVPRTDGDDILLGVRTHRFDESLGDPTGTQDSPPQGGRLVGRCNSGYR